MPAKKISELKTLTVASGNEYIPVVEKGVTYKMDMNTVAAYLQDAINAEGSTDYYYDGVKKASASVVSISGYGCSVEVDSNNDKQVNIVIPESSLEFSINDDITPDKISGLHLISNKITSKVTDGIAEVTFDGELPASANNGDVLTWTGDAWEPQSSSMSKIQFDVDGSSDGLVSKIVVLATNGLSASIDGSGVATLKKVRSSTDGIMNLMGDVSANIGSGSPTSTSSTIIKLRGYDLSSEAPVNNDVLTYIGGKWTPVQPAMGTFFGDVSASTGTLGVTASIVGIRNIPIYGNPTVNGNFLAYDSTNKRLNWTPLPAAGLNQAQVQAEIANFKEKSSIIPTQLVMSGTSNPTILVQASINRFIYYSHVSNNADYIINVKSTTTESLSGYLPNAGDSITVIVMVKTTTSPKKLLKFQIDSKDYVVKWQENTAGGIPTGLPSNGGIHSWCFSIVKTTNNSTAADYLVLGSLTNFI